MPNVSIKFQVTSHLRSPSTLPEQAQLQKAVYPLCICMKTKQSTSPKTHGYGVHDTLPEEKGKNRVHRFGVTGFSGSFPTLVFKSKKG